MDEKAGVLHHPPEWAKRDFENYELRQLDEKRKKREGPRRPSLSSAGRCARSLWYSLYKPELSQGLGARAFANFELGDMIEQRMKFWLNDIYGENYRGFYLTCKRCGHDRRVYSRRCTKCESADFSEHEDTVYFRAGIDNKVTAIAGHIDGILDCPDGITRCVEIKTASNYAFMKAEPNENRTGELSYDYACQATAYLTAMGLEETIFYYIRKETSDLAIGIYRRQPELVPQIEHRFGSVVFGSKDVPLPREYAPSVITGTRGKVTALKLGYPCSYCEFSTVCYPTFQVEFFERSEKGQKVKVPTLVDRTGTFETPEAAQAAE